jgi:hypothetical protein
MNINPIALALLGVLILTACNEGIKAETCTLTVGHDLVCIDYYNNDRDIASTLSTDEYQRYMDAVDYMKALDVRQDVLAQVYAQVVRAEQYEIDLDTYE